MCGTVTRKIIIKLVLFLAGLFLIMWKLTELLTLKEYPIPGPNVNILIDPYVLCDKQDGFYSLQKDSLDVVFLGSSNVHCNINPDLIWNDYGFTSYDFTCDSQELGTTYYYLQQMFKTQSPQVVVVDVFAGGDTDSIDDVSAHFAFDHMKNDLIKIKAIWNRTKESRLEMYFPIITYHSRWSELTRNDFEYTPYNRHNSLNGCFVYMVQNKQDEFKLPESMPSKAELPERTKHWIDLISAETQRNGGKCLFIKTPFSSYDEEWYPYFDAVEEYCREKDIPFLSLCYMSDAIGLDSETDYADNMHMNWNGQRKMSEFLGRYLQKEYGLSDKRDMKEYAQWDEDYEKMMYYITNFDDLYQEKE